MSKTEMKIQIGERIAQLRKAQKMTQQDLADKMGVMREAITYWENGNRAIKSEYITKLSEVLNVSCDYLLTGELSKETLISCSPTPIGKFASGVSDYIHAKATIDIFFPVDKQGKAHINCYQCKMFSRNNGVCQLTKEVSEYPSMYVGSNCPLDILNGRKED